MENSEFWLNIFSTSLYCNFGNALHSEAPWMSPSTGQSEWSVWIPRLKRANSS